MHTALNFPFSILQFQLFLLSLISKTYTMCVETMTETMPARQKDGLRKTSTQQAITELTAAKPDITMHRGECSLCNCKAYVNVDVGICENCGHHYDSHRY